MKKVLITMLVAMAMVLLSISFVRAADDLKPKPSRWAGPNQPTTLMPHTEKGFQVEVVSETPSVPQRSSLKGVMAPSMTAPASSLGRVCLVIDNTVSLITQTAYVQMLSQKGYSVIVSKFRGSAENLRKYFQTLYASPEGLVGAIIGTKHYVLFEHMDDWGDGNLERSEFPCDLFFADMDGQWLDQGGNGLKAKNRKYDRWNDPTHQIEIWVSRIPTTVKGSGIPQKPADAYFQKVITFTTQHPTLGQALVYDDDDWGDILGNQDLDNLSRIVPSENIHLFADHDAAGNMATAGDFTNYQMSQTYGVVTLRSHGSPDGHGFYQNYREGFDWVPTLKYLEKNPNFSFTPNLFVCSGANYLYKNFLAGVTVLRGNGLLTVGSTKTGGMWFQEETFYGALADGKSFGEAFKSWFNNFMTNYDAGYEEAWTWAAGMVIIGDGTLSLK